MQLEITWDRGQLAPFKDRGLERALVATLSKSGRDAIRALKAESSRVVRARKRLKVKRVNAALPLTFPKGRDISDLVWRMDVSGEAVRVVDYPHRQTRKGVSVAINVGKRKLIKGAFLATMKSGHRGVFKREGKARLPIDELFSTRVSDVFGDAGMIPAVQERAQLVFSQTFDRVLPLELRKLGLNAAGER